VCKLLISEPGRILARHRQEIAAEAAKATDPEKLQQLTEELEQALDQRDHTLHCPPMKKPDSNCQQRSRIVSFERPHAACSDLLSPLSRKSFWICLPSSNSMSDFACSKLLA
jgi:hypothetical protein